MYGLIGYPLGHSFSPSFFKKKFKKLGIVEHYELFPIPNINDVAQLVNDHAALKGFNVTIPYKEQILPFLAKLDDEAAQIGAVNCVKINADGQLVGYNTDVIGFRESLKPLLKPYHKSALILGTGGASKAVQLALEQLNITYQFVSTRGNGLEYSAISPNILAHHLVVINCTPLGMYPNVEACPLLPYESITKQHLFYDLIYNPDKTQFLKLAENQGATIKNGEEMLILQAEASWEIWTDKNR